MEILEEQWWLLVLIGERYGHVLAGSSLMAPSLVSLILIKNGPWNLSTMPVSTVTMSMSCSLHVQPDAASTVELGCHYHTAAS